MNVEIKDMTAIKSAYEALENAHVIMCAASILLLQKLDT